MTKNLYVCPVCKKTFKNERAVTVHLIYKHRKVLTEDGKPIDLNIEFTEASSKIVPTSGSETLEAGAQPESIPVAPAIIPKRKPFSNLNEVLEAQLEIQAKIAELRLLGQLDINSMMGGSQPDLAKQLEMQKEEKVQNSLAELKDLILSMQEAEDSGSQDSGVESAITEAVLDKLVKKEEQKTGETGANLY